MKNVKLMVLSLLILFACSAFSGEIKKTAKNDDVEKISSFLNSGINPNLLDKGRLTPLLGFPEKRRDFFKNDQGGVTGVYPKGKGKKLLPSWSTDAQDSVFCYRLDGVKLDIPVTQLDKFIRKIGSHFSFLSKRRQY